MTKIESLTESPTKTETLLELKVQLKLAGAKTIKKFSSMSDKDLTAAIAEKDQLMENSKKTFKNTVEKLQETYQKLSSNKDAMLEEIKNSGLGLLKAIHASKSAAGNDEL
jgi:urate oxidase